MRERKWKASQTVRLHGRQPMASLFKVSTLFKSLSAEQTRIFQIFRPTKNRY